jgi:hypothetical protein
LSARVFSEARWLVKIDAEGRARHLIDVSVFNVATRNRAELTTLSVNLPSHAQVELETIEGWFNGQRLEPGDIYWPDLSALAINLESEKVEEVMGARNPAEIAFRFRQLDAVQSVGGRRYVSFDGFNPTGLRASTIDLTVCLPRYDTWWQRLTAFLHSAATRRPIYDPQPHGLTLRDIQPLDPRCRSFSCPPLAGPWSHRLEYTWSDLRQLHLNVLSTAVGCLGGLVVGVVGDIILWAVFQR